MDILLDDDAMAANGSDSFQYNDILDGLAFDFAGVNINCEATVRSVEIDEVDQSQILIGAEFVDLPPVEQRVLERSIMRIQRDRIKLSGAFEADMAMA
jgi:hypothetical protein